MSSTRKKSTSSNSSDKERDFLEEEFLKIKIEDIPGPKEGLEDYEKEVLEIMKSGCNRQIAEYVMLEYKKLEEDENKKEPEKKTLPQLRKDYYDIGRNVIDITKENVVKDIESNAKIEENDENFLEGYEDEIEEILEDPSIKKLDDNKKENIESYIIKYLKKNIDELNEEDKKKYYSRRKEYIDKREAVIEAALRHVKKIVNDDNEYKKFYKGYYGNDEPEY